MTYPLLLFTLFLIALSPLSNQTIFDNHQLASQVLLRTTASLPKPATTPTTKHSADSGTKYSNTVSKSLILFCAPQRSSYEYRSRFDDIIDFFANITLRVLLPNGENVLILTDAETRPYLLAKSIPDDVLLNANLSSIFLRDFAPVIANRPVRFRYRPLHLPDYAAKNISGALDAFFSAYRLPLEHYSGLILDGGNVVDNGMNKAIVTDRVIYDNTPRYNNDQINLMLSDALGYTDIAILSELTGDILGHGGEMVAFIDAQTVALGKLDDWLHQRVIKELRKAFGGAVRVVTIPNTYGGSDRPARLGSSGDVSQKSSATWHGLPSACDLYVNMLLTDTAVYLPQFADSKEWASSPPLHSQGSSDWSSRPRSEGSYNRDTEVRSIIENNTGRKVVPIHIPSSICSMGVSLRRISWQVKGQLADRLIWLARKY